MPRERSGSLELKKTGYILKVTVDLPDGGTTRKWITLETFDRPTAERMRAKIVAQLARGELVIDEPPPRLRNVAATPFDVARRAAQSNNTVAKSILSTIANDQARVDLLQRACLALERFLTAASEEDAALEGNELARLSAEEVRTRPVAFAADEAQRTASTCARSTPAVFELDSPKKRGPKPTGTVEKVNAKGRVYYYARITLGDGTRHRVPIPEKHETDERRKLFARAVQELEDETGELLSKKNAEAAA